MLAPVLAIAVLLRAVEAIKIFDIIFVTTAGGPGSATETITMYARTVGMQQFSLGYASTQIPKRRTLPLRCAVIFYRVAALV